jgi:hypothetical protein
MCPVADEEPAIAPGAPCRLFVYLARAALVGVVLRRGPSEWARLSVWHTGDDTFDHGQWIKGRVYERRSDISADGSLFAAFIRQGGARPAPTADSWVAISRPPYFTALALWFVGGTYHTGAFFPTPSLVWHGFEERPPDMGSLPVWLDAAPPRDIPYVDLTSEWTDRTVHFNRLLRDGWHKTEDDVHATTWERSHPGTPSRLVMRQRFAGFDRYGGPYLVDYSIRDGGEATIDLGEATWADWDHRGRLALTREGRLLSWHRETGFREIQDFNDQRPNPQPAPDWATAWPSQ